MDDSAHTSDEDNEVMNIEALAKDDVNKFSIQRDVQPTTKSVQKNVSKVAEQDDT